MTPVAEAAAVDPAAAAGDDGVDGGKRCSGVSPLRILRSSLLTSRGC